VTGEKELADFAAWLRRRGYKEKTIERYCYTVRRRLAGKPPRSRSDVTALTRYAEFLTEKRAEEARKVKRQKEKSKRRRGIFLFPWW